MGKIKGWKKEENQSVYVVRKIGKWDIGLIKYPNGNRVRLMVRGDWYGENPIIYPHKRQVGYDRPEQVPQSVKDYIYKNAEKLYDLELKENNKLATYGYSNYMRNREW